MSVSVNEAVAARLRELAEILDPQGANPFRVAAYRRAAEAIRQVQDPREIYAKEGVQVSRSSRPSGW